MCPRQMMIILIVDDSLHSCFWKSCSCSCLMFSMSAGQFAASSESSSCSVTGEGSPSSTPQFWCELDQYLQQMVHPVHHHMVKLTVTAELDGDYNEQHKMRKRNNELLHVWRGPSFEWIHIHTHFPVSEQSCTNKLFT